MSYRYLPGNGPIIALVERRHRVGPGYQDDYRHLAPGVARAPQLGRVTLGALTAARSGLRPRTSGSRSRYPVRRCPRPRRCTASTARIPMRLHQLSHAASPPGTVLVTGVGEIDSAPPALSSLSGSRTRGPGA